MRAVEKALSRSDDRSLVEVADSLHVSLSSMNKWIALSREPAFEPRGDVEFMSQFKEKRPQDWSLEERFKILIKSNGLAKNEVSAICRKQGIHPHHLQQWQKDFISRKPSLSQFEKAELKVLKS